MRRRGRAPFPCVTVQQEEASPSGCWPATVAACVVCFVSSLLYCFRGFSLGMQARHGSSESSSESRERERGSQSSSLPALAPSCAPLCCLCQPPCLHSMAPPRRCQGWTHVTRHTSQDTRRTCQRGRWLCARGSVIPPCPCLAYSTTVTTTTVTARGNYGHSRASGAPVQGHSAMS